MIDTYEDALGWIGDETTRLFDIAIDSIPSGSAATFVELGTYRGKSSICLYDKIQESGKDITLYTVDDWTRTEPHDQPGDDNRSIFIENKGTRNINLIESASLDAVEEFNDKSIDFLFMDTNSQWGDLSNEIYNWIPKMKNGSIISGHDYHFTGIGMVVNSIFPDAIVIEESITHTAEFPDIQPPEWKFHSWYTFVTDSEF